MQQAKGLQSGLRGMQRKAKMIMEVKLWLPQCRCSISERLQKKGCLLVYTHTQITWLDKKIFSEMWSLSLKSEHLCIMIYWCSVFPSVMGRPSAFPTSVTQYCWCWGVGTGPAWSSSTSFYETLARFRDVKWLSQTWIISINRSQIS